MKQNNPLFKGSLSTIILKLLGEEPRMYGYEIMKKVKELSGDDLSLTEGALYPALHKLEADGHITATLEQVDNRLRKYYSLTPSGKTEAANKLNELQEFFGQLQAVLQLKLSNN